MEAVPIITAAVVTVASALFGWLRLRDGSNLAALKARVEELAVQHERCEKRLDWLTKKLAGISGDEK